MLDVKVLTITILINMSAIKIINSSKNSHWLLHMRNLILKLNLESVYLKDLSNKGISKIINIKYNPYFWNKIISVRNCMRKRVA